MKKKLFNFLGAAALLAGFGFVANALNASPVAHEEASESSIYEWYIQAQTETFSPAEDNIITMVVDADHKHSLNTKYTGTYTGLSGVEINCTKGLKMEGSTLIEFTTEQPVKIVVAQCLSSNSANNIAIDMDTIPTDQAQEVGNVRVYTKEAPAGRHTVTRGNSEAGIMYIGAELLSGSGVEEPGLAVGTAVKATWTCDTVGGANVLKGAVVPAAAAKAEEMTLGSNLEYKSILTWRDSIYYSLTMKDQALVDNDPSAQNRVCFTMTAEEAVDVKNVSFDLILDGWGDGRMRTYLYAPNDTIELTSATITPTRNRDAEFDANPNVTFSYPVENVKLAKGESVTLAVALFAKKATGSGKGYGLNNIAIDATVAEAAGETPVEPEPEPETYTIDLTKPADLNIAGTFVEETLKADGTVQARAHWQPIDYIKDNGFKLTFTTNGSTAPALYDTASGAYELRMYGSASYQTTMTVAAPAGKVMTSIVSQNTGGSATPDTIYKASVGTLDFSNATNVKWTWNAENNSALGANEVTFTYYKALKYNNLTITYIADPNFVPNSEVVAIDDILGEEDPIYPEDGSVLEDGLNGITMLTITDGEVKGNAACKEAATLKQNGKVIASVTTADLAQLYDENAKLPNYTLEGEESEGTWYTMISFAFASEFISAPGSYVVNIPEGFFLLGNYGKTGAYELNYRVPGLVETTGEQIGTFNTAYYLGNASDYAYSVESVLKGTVVNENDTVTVVANNFLNTGINLSLSFAYNTSGKAELVKINTALEEDEEGGYLILGEENYPVATVKAADGSLIDFENPYIYSGEYTTAKFKEQAGDFPTNFQVQICMWGDDGSESGADFYAYLNVAVPEPKKEPVYPDVTGTEASVNWQFDGTAAIPEGIYSVPGVFSANKVEFGEGYTYDRTRYIGGKDNPGCILSSCWNVSAVDNVLSFSATPACEFVPTEFVMTWASVKHGSAYFTITAERGDEVVVVAEHIQPGRTQEAATEVETEEGIASYTKTYRIPVFEKNEGEIVVKVTCDQVDKARGIDFADAKLNGVVPTGVEIPGDSVKELVIDMEGADIYDLSGRKVLGQPAPGIYVVVKGNKAVKAVIR